MAADLHAIKPTEAHSAGAQEPPTLLDVLAVIALGAGETEYALFEDGVAANSFFRFRSQEIIASPTPAVIIRDDNINAYRRNESVRPASYRAS
jgi:hypothetical protein